MSSSASSTNGHAGRPDAGRHALAERLVARILVAALVVGHPLSAGAGSEFSDADRATFDASQVRLDNSQAGQTTFTIDAKKAAIGWDQLQQPADNRLEFRFTNGGRKASVLNYSESVDPFRIAGQVVSNGTVGFANPYGVFIDGTAVIDVGSLVAIAGSVSREAFERGGPIDLPLTGRIENRGLVRADDHVALLATSVLNAGDVLARGGRVLMVGGTRVELPELDVLSAGFAGDEGLAAQLSGGEVENAGRIRSADAALMGGHVLNLGEIHVDDGSLLMVGADAVYVTRFDDPVVVRLPRGSVGTGGDGMEPASGSARYAIENQGTIDAGRGHVRLAAADPLGFGIRQGTGPAGPPARIAARTIELDAGADGRVQLSGRVDASDDSKRGRGGQIDVTGAILALSGATLDVSGTRGGGRIRVGGDLLGGGDLPRARAVLVDEASVIRADATRRGDGGRVILFSEDLTSIEGQISARGGRKGGDGGFVETSGLARFALATAPDVSARRGASGDWLIDPYDITIRDITGDLLDVSDPGCQLNGAGTACTNDLGLAIEAILDPDFDNIGFDGILRTTGPADNVVSTALIERALGIGTNITLSTQAFLDDPINGAGDITIEDAISIDSQDVLEGTIARLTLLAAGNIFVDAPIEVVPIGAGAGERSNLALSLELHANDADQTAAGRAFDLDLVRGSVFFNADVRTGGGSVTATGISIEQQAGRSIVTRGGDVTMTSGLVSPLRTPFTLGRQSDTPSLDDDGDGLIEPEDSDGLASIDPRMQLEGVIDTRIADGRTAGGDVTLTASSVGVAVLQSGKDALELVTGLLRLAGDVWTGGGDVSLSGGPAPSQTDPSTFAGEVEVTGLVDTATRAAAVDCHGTLDCLGGDLSIQATRVNPAVSNRDFTIVALPPEADPTRGEGGRIAIDGAIVTGGGAASIGNDSTRSIELDGFLDTTSLHLDPDGLPDENGLVRLIARDATGVEERGGGLGAGRIAIGTNGGAAITTAGLTLRTRDLETGASGGANAVDVVLVGDSSSTLFSDAAQTGAATSAGLDPDAPLAGVLDVEAGHAAVFHADTALAAETVRIATAAIPLEVTEAERTEAARLVFEGANGGGATAADGVRIQADTISLATGDGATPTADLFAGDLGTPSEPTDLAISRQTGGDYGGLQLRDASGVLRPAAITIRQDGGLAITQGAATQAGELDLAGAFGGAQIGDDGMRLSLESSDGVLRIDDAAGFNDNAGPLDPDIDAGKSFVTLLGGLLLPIDDTGLSDPTPEVKPSPNSVVFGADLTGGPNGDPDGIGDLPLGVGGTTAFDVASLTVSTPGDLSVVQQILDSIASVSELLFESGRDPGVDGAAGRGTMTIAAATSLTAGDRLSLAAGRSGFGDLVFAGPGITLASDEIALSAGSFGASQNTASSDRSAILGLQAQDVALRDAAGGFFGDAVSTATAFRYRQAAGVDAAVDLPTLLQFGLADSGPGAGFRATGDVVYAVRSDEGQIDLDDGLAGTNEADRFRNAALSLVGLETNAARAILVSADTAFTGRHVELGGVTRFTFDADHARAFNRSGTDAEESLTLRAGLGGAGSIAFASDVNGPVTVQAPTVRLVAGDGDGAGSGSRIDVRNALFDLTGPPGADRTFVYQIDGSFRASDLPSADAFVGGAAGLPTVLAIRNDGGLIELPDFDAAELPIAIATEPSRLVLEAETVELAQKDGDDLDLTTSDDTATNALLSNLVLRIRANVLNLIAFVSNDKDVEDGVVHMGPRPGDTQRLTGADADFDGESLLVEAFDRASELATTGNLSTVSEEPAGSGLYDLAAGRGPTTIRLSQDGDVEAEDLAHRASFSGLLARVFRDEADDPDRPIATRYEITSQLGTVSITPEKVNGSSLSLSGQATAASDSAFSFEPGASANPGRFELADLEASTEQSIVVAAGTEIIATNSISLRAADIARPDAAVTAELGSLRFEGSHLDGNVTRLEANRIALIAGTSFALTSPDANRDGERDPIDPAFLPRLDLAGLDALVVKGDARTSLLRMGQNADFDVRRGQAGDFLTALEAGAAQAGPGGAEWRDLELVSLQGELNLTELDLIADEATNLLARNGADGTTVIRMPDAVAAPFNAFAGGARIESNDVKFWTDDAATGVDLATDRLSLVSLAAATATAVASATSTVSTTTVPLVGRLRSDIAQDENPVLRPIVRIEQDADFTSAALPRPSQYALVDANGATVRRPGLAGLDIELRSTGGLLTLDDGVRARTTGSNLILRSTGDIVFSLSDLTPGYEDILDEADQPKYAALQLASLDAEAGATILRGAKGSSDVAPGEADGSIVFAPFTVDAAPAALSLETRGDQRLATGPDGAIVLANALETRGRAIDFTADVVQQGDPEAGLTVGTSGRVRFAGDVGTDAARLAWLHVEFDGDSGDGQDARTPSVEFGRRSDVDGDGIAETPVASSQTVAVRDDIRFTARYTKGDQTLDGRARPANFATIAKALGDLAFSSSNGSFETTAGEKLSVGGTLSISTPTGRTALSDVSALVFEVVADTLALLRRASGIVLDASGETRSDAGPAISANGFAITAQNVELAGSGRAPRLGLPDPFDAQTAQPLLDALATPLPLFALRPNGRELTTADFRFTDPQSALAERVPFLIPTGASRSDLSGAFGPTRVPTSHTEIAAPRRLANPERLRALDVITRPTPEKVAVARLEGAAVIDDRGLASRPGTAIVSEARLDARDAEEAIRLYRKLFGEQDERAGQVRDVLQNALDAYLESHRARRVVGFELRRFVKNRPSTLIDAYTTLEDLDALFRYHRRLGLSPGEFKRIQRGWLEKIQPEGISLDELAETVHPSRYVRGSDILDIFGE
ncbi:MAG: hypothetical protein R3F35_19710 [Myxococcota bacterium]